MTSEERREARFLRRRRQRIEKRHRLHPGADDFQTVFSFANLWASYRKCRKNVGWKGSVQRYTFAAPMRVTQAHRQLMMGKYKCVVPHEWDTWERGKQRHIKSVPIGERVVQRCLADNALLPLLAPSFVYDNGACLSRKGYDFAMRRLECHLQRHYRKHGNEGYILLFDFSKFYENINHNLIRSILGKYFHDPRIRKITDQILATFGTNGLGLGSQISQVLALAAASPLDHAIKQDMRVKEYARYNDDGYLIHHSKEFLHDCLSRIQAICDKLHIRLNMKKTQIVKLSHGFKFLKARIYLTDTGNIIRKLPKKSIVRQRRKIKSLNEKLKQGLIDMPHIYMQHQSWRAYALKFRAYLTVQSMDALFFQTYVFKEAV